MINRLFLIIITGLILYGCSSDPVSTNGGTNGNGYVTVYSNSGTLDSITCGSIFTNPRSLGNLDFTNSDSVKISLEYIANNTTSYGIRIFYMDGSNEIDLINVTIPGNQNTYTSVEFTAPSPGVQKEFLYIMTSDGTNCYFVIRNIILSKK